MFDESTTADPQTQEVEVNDVPSVLGLVTNEDGSPKYANVEEGFKALAAAQEHIQTLETENSTFREDLSKRQTTEELLTEIKNQSQPERVQDPSSNKGIDPAQVSTLVEQTMTAREQAKAVQDNQQNVVQTLRGHFGDNAEKAFADKATELGVSVPYLEEIAGRSPKAALMYFDLKSTSSIPQASGTVNTESIAPVQDLPSAKIAGGSTKDLVNAWNNAGKLIDN